MKSRGLLSLVRKPTPPPKMSARADWSRSAACVRAQSILCGVDFRDGFKQCPPLEYNQALDVLAWAGERIEKGN